MIDLYNRGMPSGEVHPAVSLTGDAYFGLHLGEYLNLSAAGLISQITQTCRTIREALEYCCSFAALGCRALPMVLEERTADYRLRLIPDPLWWEASPVAVRQTVAGLEPPCAVSPLTPGSVWTTSSSMKFGSSMLIGAPL